MPSQSIALLLALIMTALSVVGCQRTPERESDRKRVIRLDRLSPLPPAPKKPGSRRLRVAVAAILSPRGTVTSYRPLLGYLERKSGERVELVQRRTYKEINHLIAANEVDLAFICTGAYQQGRRDGIMRLLVIPRIDGRTTYNSILIAGAASTARGLEDFRNKVFVFTDPLSNSGYLYPMSLLKRMGERPETFFKSFSFTYSHDRSIEAVADGLADGAFIDSIVYRYHRREDNKTACRTRIVFTSPPFGIPPVVVPAGQLPRKTAALREIFLHIHEEPQGRKALDALGIERFVEAKTDRYQREPCR